MPPPNPYFFHGKRTSTPSHTRPTVHGGLFSNRRTEPPSPTTNHHPNHRNQKPTIFSPNKWDPHPQFPPKPPQPAPPATAPPQTGRHLSPIARYVFDSFNRHSKWGPPVVSDLSRLRRLTPNVVAEVLKVVGDVSFCSKLFHWAGKQKGFRHNYVSYNAYEYALCRLNRFRAADRVPELMSMQGRLPSEKQFEILIRLHGERGRGLRVYHVYERMVKQFGVRPRVFLYNRIMDALVKTEHLDLALSVYDDFRKAGLLEETVTFMILVKGFCRSGRIDEMLEVLGRMRRVCRPDVFAYTAMIRVLVGEGNLDGCLRVWDEMRTDGVQPDAMAYTTLISALCKGGRVEKGYEFFKGMKNKGGLIDRAIYSSLVEGFVEDGKVGSALDLLKDMTDCGYRADLCVYNSLIRGFCNIKQVDKAFKLFQVTLKEGLQPDFTTVIPMLESYAESREMDRFRCLLLEMDKVGADVLDGLSLFFSSMVEREDNLPLTLMVFEDLKIKGYCSVPIYNILLEALYKSAQTKEALSLFSEIRKDTNLTPDSTTYSHAITCFVDVGDVKEACTWYNRIKEQDSVPSTDAYQSLVKGLCKIGQIDPAVSLVQDCLANVASGPMEFKYTLTIIHMCKSNDAEKVLEVVNEMIDQGCLPDEIICCAVISGMCKHGTIEEARKVFSSFREQNLLTEANAILYDDMLLEHMKKKTADLVVSGLKFFGLESKLKAKGCTLLSN
ncbi:hypothetical protein vseg_008749 [Gypsophila vaccaria]